ARPLGEREAAAHRLAARLPAPRALTPPVDRRFQPGLQLVADGIAELVAQARRVGDHARRVVAGDRAELEQVLAADEPGDGARDLGHGRPAAGADVDRALHLARE